MAETTPEQLPKVEPAPPLETALPTAPGPEQAPIQPTSVAIPGLSSGDGLGTAATKDDGTSGWLLRDLAEPKLFTGPEVDLQADIVDKLEKEIAKADASALEPVRKWQAEVAAYRKSDAELDALSPEEQDAYFDGLNALEEQRPEVTTKYHQSLLYLGSIVLDQIPTSSAGDGAMIDQAKLTKRNDHALKSEHESGDLTTLTGLDKAIVTNTMATMVKARQIEYLRRSGITGDGWQVVVEVHYYRSRATTANELHKDTLGQTLFVNLSFTNDQEVAGPEYVANPPQIDDHKDKIKETLPKRFYKDLKTTRNRPGPTEVQTSTLPANGVIAFVDEAIHHATPLVGHRTVTAGLLGHFLKYDEDFKEVFPQALPHLVSIESDDPADQPPPAETMDAFRERFGAGRPPEVVDRWAGLKRLCERHGRREVTRPELTKAGLTEQQVDRLLATHGTGKIDAVSIPKQALVSGKGERKPLTTGTGKETRPLVLKRRMSTLADEGKLPPTQPEATPRRFFRTWVRAVRVKPMDTSGSATATPTAPPK